MHTAKVNKILNSFQHFNRNLGVLLSGDKGIGKSLFVKLLALKAMEQGIPVITINNGYDGLTTFIDSIRQEVLIIFDEFNKNYHFLLMQNLSYATVMMGKRMKILNIKTMMKTMTVKVRLLAIVNNNSPLPLNNTLVHQ